MGMALVFTAFQRVIWNCPVSPDRLARFRYPDDRRLPRRRRYSGSVKNGYRYLQDYGMGPETPLGEPKTKYMELGPRDKVSCAFWHEWRKGNTHSTPRGDVAFTSTCVISARRNCMNVCRSFANWRKFFRVGALPDPVKEPIPACPTRTKPPWAALKPTRTVSRVSVGRLPPANAPLLACMARTARFQLTGRKPAVFLVVWLANSNGTRCYGRRRNSAALDARAADMAFTTVRKIW